MNIKLEKVIIIGLGVIGGSIGLALKRNNAAKEVVGMDTDEKTLQKALELGAIDRISCNIEKELCSTQLVILSTHLSAIDKVLHKIAPYLPKGCIVTDVTSVKCRAIKIIKDILPEGIHYVGGHPMAGSEKTGIEAAEPFLFQNAIYVLTPSGQEPQDVVDTLKFFVRMLDAKPILLEPERHDLLAAMVSHMPYLAATCLNLTVSRMDETGEAFALAASGFRDTTRIASSHPGMWADICTENREALLKVLTSFQEILSNLQHIIADKQRDVLLQNLEEAKNIRDEIPNIE